MFEKEAEEIMMQKVIKENDCIMTPCKTLEDCQLYDFCFDDMVDAFKDGAKFGYNKANEWHEIESKVSPKREISKQYMPKNKEKVLLKYHFSGDDEVHISDGYYDAYDFEFHIANNPKFRIVCVIAWKEIVLSELKESE